MSKIPQELFELMDEIAHTESLGRLSDISDQAPWLLEASATAWNDLEDEEPSDRLASIKMTLMKIVFSNIKSAMDIKTRFDEVGEALSYTGC